MKGHAADSQFNATHPRHSHVGQGPHPASPPANAKRLLAARGPNYPKVAGALGTAHRVQDGSIVVYDKHRPRRGGTSPGRRHVVARASGDACCLRQEKVTTVPLPGGQAREILPPCVSTICWHRQSPNPSPLALWL